MYRITLGILFLLMLGSIAQLAYQIPHLPEQVPSHFAADGTPDGFMQRSSYVIMQLALHVGMPAFLITLACTLPMFPNSLINMSHKEYWLADERRASTLRSMSTMLICTAILCQILLIGISHLGFIASLNNSELSMVGFWILMGLFLTGMTALVIEFQRRHRLPRPVS